MNAIEDLDAYAKRYRDALAAELRAQREDSAVTFREIAAYTGMDVNQIHRYLSGKRDIPFSRLRALAEAIGVDLGAAMAKVEDRLD